MTATEIWDPREHAWKRGAPLPTGRSGATAVVLNSWLYVFGGEGDRLGGAFGDAERFTLSENQWERLVPMPTPRHGLGSACVEGAIYAISGGTKAGFSYGAANERFVPFAAEGLPFCEQWCGTACHGRVGGERFAWAEARFPKQGDQAFSFTDCTSFEIMRERKLEAALASDGHFRIAGFAPLLAGKS